MPTHHRTRRAVRCARTPALLASACLFAGTPAAPAGVTLTGDTTPAPGNEASINSSTDLYIGDTGVGGLLVDADSDLASGGGYLGHSAGAAGTATVTGSGSTWTSSGHLYAGYHGVGTLRVEGGGVVNTASGSVGFSSGSSGSSATVTGADSAWHNSGNLTVARYGNATLLIENGGQVSNVNATLADVLSSMSGAVTVTGANSTWTNSGWLRVGSAGTGTLTLTDSGRVETGDDLSIAYNAGSTGTVNLHGGTLDLNGNDISFGAGSATFSFTSGTLLDVHNFGSDLNHQGGTIEIGDDAAADVMIVQGHYTQADGSSLQIDLANGFGLVGASFDQLQVTGDATLAGLLDVLLDAGYSPTQSDTWDVLSAGSITLDSTFALADPAGYDLDYQIINSGLGQTLRLTLIPEPASAAALALLTLGLGRRRRGSANRA